jgi:hypothetical protein
MLLTSRIGARTIVVMGRDRRIPEDYQENPRLPHDRGNATDAFGDASPQTPRRPRSQLGKSARVE